MNDTVLALSGVTKTYPVGEGRVTALKPANLSVAAGELVALTGPSGSGKSTMLNLCGLIDTPDAGRREIAGQAVEGLDERALTWLRRERVGFIFQSYNLVPVMTAFENVEYPLMLLGVSPAERRRRVADWLGRVGIGELAGRLPDALSGGQRQRVAIARALVKSPALVVADEPTANLDSATASDVVDLLHALAREQASAVVVATHDPRMADRCDRVLAMHDGELL